MEIPKISFLENCTSFTLIDEGFSNDEKWCVDNTYLLRISPNADIVKLRKQAELTNAVNAIDSHIPYAHEVGTFNGKSFVILDYIKGKDGNNLLPSLSEVAQYRIGQQVGQTLKRMHSIPASPEYPIWEDRWKQRVEVHSKKFEKIALTNGRYEKVLPFINKHLYLLKDRPSCIQHYDFHPGNILIHEDNFTGLIDMQKITYGDPINEFYKMEYFNVPISRTYSCGVFDGYHDNKPIPKEFWELHRLYAAMHIMAAEVYGAEFALNQREKFQQFTRFTLNQFDDFTVLIPKWYEQK